jgi:hypothetical protein
MSKFCFNCDHITPGDPWFCNHCGCSYDVKLCPRRHVNARTAEACSQCGSRDLSTPQPRRPFWVLPLEYLLTIVPGAFLGIASAVVLLGAIATVAQHPDMAVLVILFTIPFGILWAMWTELPSWFRNWVYRLLKRRRERHERGNE